MTSSFRRSFGALVCLAVGAIAPMGCGGGGTTSGADAGSPPQALSARSSTNGSDAFTPFGIVTVAQGIQADDPANPLEPQGPVVTRLAGGGAALAWVSGSSLVAQQIDSSGHNVGPQQAIATLAGPVWAYAVGGLNGGDWVVAWADLTLPQLNQTPHGQPYTIQTKRFDARGAFVGDTTLVVPGISYSAVDSHLQVRAMPDGGYVVAFSAAPGSPQMFATYQRFADDGTAVGAPVFVAGSGENQSRLQVVPLANRSIVAVWEQQSTTATGTSYSLYTRHFDAAGNPVTQPTQITAAVYEAPFEFAATLLQGQKIGIAWMQPAIPAVSISGMSWQIMDKSGKTIATGTPTQQRGLDGVDVAPSDKGFTVFYQVSSNTARGGISQLNALQIDHKGSVLGTTSVVNRQIWLAPSSGGPAGPASTGFAVAGGSDGHYVAAFESAIAGGAEVDAFGQ
jgi:hypothetical protein